MFAGTLLCAKVNGNRGNADYCSPNHLVGILAFKIYVFGLIIALQVDRLSRVALLVAKNTK